MIKWDDIELQWSHADLIMDKYEESNISSYIVYQKSYNHKNCNHNEGKVFRGLSSYCNFLEDIFWDFENNEKVIQSMRNIYGLH